MTGCQFESGTEKRHGLHRRGEVGHIKRVGGQVLCGNKFGGNGSSMVQQCLLGHQPLFWSEVSQIICLEHMSRTSRSKCKIWILSETEIVISVNFS